MKKTPFISKLHTKVLAICSSCFTFLLGCLPTSAAYGCPHADLKVEGIIRSQVDSQPIQGLEISLNESAYQYASPPVYSALNGSFKCSTNYYIPDVALTLSIKDIDGTENGSFSDKDTVLLFKESELQGSSEAWYLGEITKSVTIYLTEKQ